MSAIKYTDLVAYCDVNDLNYTELAQRIGMNYTTFHAIIRGTCNAGKKSRRKLNAFIAANEREIRAALSVEPEVVHA